MPQQYLTEQEIVARLNLLGWKNRIEKTGSPFWRRIYFTTPEGQALGRVSIHNGIYDGVHWHNLKIGTTGPITKWEQFECQWRYLMLFDKLLDNAHFEACKNKAWELANARTTEIQAKRQAKPRREDGTPYKRGKLAPPNPRRFLWELLIERPAEGSNTAVQPLSGAV